MRFSLKICFFLILTFCFSCEEQAFFIKCNECTEDEPIITSIELKYDISFDGTPVLVKVYEGNLEDSVLYRSFNVFGTASSIYNITVNKKYTITATYYIPDNYYITVDSAFPRIKYVKDQCENPCYYVYDRVINLRLKYNKK